MDQYEIKLIIRGSARVLSAEKRDICDLPAMYRPPLSLSPNRFKEERITKSYYHLFLKVSNYHEGSDEMVRYVHMNVFKEDGNNVYESLEKMRKKLMKVNETLTEYFQRTEQFLTEEIEVYDVAFTQQMAVRKNGSILAIIRRQLKAMRTY